MGILSRLNRKKIIKLVINKVITMKENMTLN